MAYHAVVCFCQNCISKSRSTTNKMSHKAFTPPCWYVCVSESGLGTLYLRTAGVPAWKHSCSIVRSSQKSINVHIHVHTRSINCTCSHVSEANRDAPPPLPDAAEIMSMPHVIQQLLTATAATHKSHASHVRNLHTHMTWR